MLISEHVFIPFLTELSLKTFSGRVEFHPFSTWERQCRFWGAVGRAGAGPLILSRCFPERVAGP